MNSLGRFAAALLGKWWALMSCAVFTFIGLLALVFQKSNRWIIGTSFGSAVFLFMVAAFLAWRDEHEGRLRAESSIVRPKIDLSWGRTDISFDTEKHLIIENGGPVDAYDVQIHDVSLTPNLKGTFQPITRLKVNEKFMIDPYLAGPGIANAPNRARKFEMILYSSGNLPQEYTSSTSTGNLAEIRCPLAVSFKDYSGNQYEASFEFVADTLRYIDKIKFVKIERKDQLKRK